MDHDSVYSIEPLQPHHSQETPSIGPPIGVYTREIQTINATISCGSPALPTFETAHSSFHPRPEKQTPLPTTQNLFIPDIPVKNADGTRPHPRESWRWIVKHWTEGDPERGLLHPLKDWDSTWLRGPNKGLYAAKYGQRSMIALEFINQ